MTIDLTRPEWDLIMAILAKVAWETANPLLMKIGAQLQEQTQVSPDLRPGNSAGMGKLS